MRVLVLVLATLFLILSPAFSDSVTLNTGEVIRGEIVSETDAQIVIEISNYNKTITSHRTVAKSEIKAVERETVQQKQERQALEALAKYQLDANQEQPTNYCGQAIAEFEKFLSDYPKSAQTTIVQERVEEWHAELRHVVDGEVKFGNQWMNSKEKQLQVEQWQKQVAVQTAQGALRTAKDQLAALEQQRRQLAKNLATAQNQLASAKGRLPALRDTLFRADARSRWIPVKQVDTPYVDHLGNPIRLAPDERIESNAERPITQAEIARYEQAIAADNVSLTDLDQRIRHVGAQCAKAERDYKLALIQSQEPLKPAVAKVEQPPSASPPPPPAPIVERPVVTPPPAPATAGPPWYVRYWMGLVAGVVVPLVLVAFLYWYMRRASHAEAQREERRREAREQLKKIFDRLFIDGERPSGKNSPDGDIVPIGNGQEAPGRGRWFIIDDSYIWAVQNNGRDEDNWVYNNVITDGPGAIGARVAAEPDVVDAIRTLGKAAA